MEKYVRLKPSQTLLPDNEVRVNASTQTMNYVRYVLTQFNECGAKKVVLVAMGEAIHKVATIVEIVKERVYDLHQVNEIGMREFIDEYEPLEEGLNKLAFSRKVPCFQVTLAKTSELATGSCSALVIDIGYQEPLPHAMVDPARELPGLNNKWYFN